MSLEKRLLKEWVQNDAINVQCAIKNDNLSRVKKWGYGVIMTLNVAHLVRMSNND